MDTYVDETRPLAGEYEYDPSANYCKNKPEPLTDEYEYDPSVDDCKNAPSTNTEVNCCQQPCPICCGCCGRKVSCWVCCIGYVMVVYLFLSLPIFFIHHALVFRGWKVQEGPQLSDANVGTFKASIDGDVIPVVDHLIDKTHHCANDACAKIPVIFFAGNEDEMWASANIANYILAAAPVGPQEVLESFTSSYRGYPPNNDNIDDWASRRALTSDGTDVIDFALKKITGKTTGKVIVAGWSLGSAVSLQVAAANPHRVAGVLLLAPWSTLKEETDAFIENFGGSFARIALSPWKWAMNLDPWDSVRAVSFLPAEMPIAVVSPLQDEVIPSTQHRAVYAASPANDKVFVPVPGACHACLQDMIAKMHDPATAHEGCTMLEWVQRTLSRAKSANAGFIAV